MPILGSRLGEMFAAFLHVAKRLGRIRIRGARFKSPGALQCVLRSRLIQGGANRLQIRLMRGGNRIEIEEFHVVAASIVIAADEPRIRGNIDAFRPQALAYFLPVGHCGKKPCIRAAAAPPAGPAVMSRLVGIVEAGRSVAQDYHQSGRIRAPGQPGATRWRLVLFFLPERTPSKDPPLHFGIAAVFRIKVSSVRGSGRNCLVQPIAQKCVASRRQKVTDQGNCREQAER